MGLKRLLIRFLIMLIILSASQKGICGSPAYLDDIKNYSTPVESGVIIHTSKIVEYKWAKLKGKVYIDLKNSQLRNFNYKPISVEDGVIKLIRYAQFDLKTVRVVIETDKYKECNINKEVEPNSPNRIKIVFSGVHGVGLLPSDNKPSEPTEQPITENTLDKESKDQNIREKKIEQQPVEKKEAPKTAQNIEQKIKRKGKRHHILEKDDEAAPLNKIVVIDPGHGGSDPGAISHNGLVEKDVTLDISMRLARILKNKYGVTVYLTRNNDKFISLDKRTIIANRKNADVFVSIHVNASDRPSLKGLETFLLSWSDDKEALSVAGRENQISVSAMKRKNSELGVILSSLAREGKRDESLRLTHLIHSSMLLKVRGDYSFVEDLGVRKALFYVLVGASMPSALVEVGYLTNTQEEKRLRSKSYREDISSSIASGIYKYLTTLPDEPKYARVINAD